MPLIYYVLCGWLDQESVEHFQCDLFLSIHDVVDSFKQGHQQCVFILKPDVKTYCSSNQTLLSFYFSFPQATNQTLLDKFKRQHEGNSYIEFPAVMEPAFIIRHYAGKVKYGVKVSVIFTSISTCCGRESVFSHTFTHIIFTIVLQLIMSKYLDQIKRLKTVVFGFLVKRFSLLSTMINICFPVHSMGFKTTSEGL